MVAHAKKPNDAYIIFLFKFKKNKIPNVIAKMYNGSEIPKVELMIIFGSKAKIRAPNKE